MASRDAPAPVDALSLREACRALFTCSHRDDGINDADRLWTGHGISVVLPGALLDRLRGVGVDSMTGDAIPVLPFQRLRLLLSLAPTWPLDTFSAKRSVAAFVEDVEAPADVEASDDEVGAATPSPPEDASDGDDALFGSTKTKSKVVVAKPQDAFYASHENEPSHLVLCAAGASEPHQTIDACPFGVHVAKAKLKKGDRIVIARPPQCLDGAGRRKKRSKVTQETQNVLQSGDGRSAPSLCRGVVRYAADGRFFYDVQPEDHEDHCSLSWTGAAIFKVVNAPTGERAYRGRAQSFKHMRVELVGLRSRPRPAPPPEVDAMSRRYDLDADESSQGTRDSKTLGAKRVDEALENAKKFREKWREPRNCRNQYTHEASDIASFIDLVEDEGNERERLRDLKRQEPPVLERNDGGQRAIKRLLRKALKEFFLGAPWVPGPPPNLDAMESAARFIAENCALKGVDALIKLALAYVDIDRPDGAAECLTCVARACSKPGGGDNAASIEVLAHSACLRALAKAMRGPPVPEEAWDGQSSDDESTTSQVSRASRGSQLSNSTAGFQRRRARVRGGTILEVKGSLRAVRGMRPTAKPLDADEVERLRKEKQKADAARLVREQEEREKAAMAEELVRREREGLELLAASAGEVVAAVSRRTNYNGFKTLDAFPEAVAASLRALVQVDEREDGLGRVAPWAHATLRCADGLARGDFLARQLLQKKCVNFLRRLDPSLRALDRNGGDSSKCSERIAHYCATCDAPARPLPPIDTIDAHDGYMVRAAPKYEVAKLILLDLKRSKQPCSLESWGSVGDGLLGRRTVVTRSCDATTRPPPEPLPEDETQVLFDAEMAHRQTIVEEVERERSDPGPLPPPRKWTLARPGPSSEASIISLKERLAAAESMLEASIGGPQATEDAAAIEVEAARAALNVAEMLTREYARRALPHPLVPELKLRKRVFDRKITGRLGES